MTLTPYATDAFAVLRRIVSAHSPAALASSFGAEDMVLIDLIGRHVLPVQVFTLDTGRLHEETYELIERVRRHYGLKIAVYTSQPETLESFVEANGVNAFRDSVELRQQCCAIRKSAPLTRALAGKRAWITGQRRAQSPTRHELALEEFDTVHGLAKFNPLIEWSEKQVWEYLRGHGVPYNPLHDRGYPSIGCAPCTRAIEPGKDFRAGRWWWERPERSEHTKHGLQQSPVALPRAADRFDHASV
jgi:phosphoadenosine phosphosulfate reductase